MTAPPDDHATWSSTRRGLVLTVTITLRPPFGDRLLELARLAGMAPTTYVRAVLGALTDEKVVAQIRNSHQ